MSSDGRDDEQNRRDAEEKIPEEDYNRAKRALLLEKHKNKTYPTEGTRSKAEEKAYIKQLRTERLAIKEERDTSKKRRQSQESALSDFFRLPQFTVRRKSASSAYSSIVDPDRVAVPEATAYYPHQGVRRSIVDDLAQGGSRRATEPLKIQLLEIIDGMAPDSKFIEEKKRIPPVKTLGVVVTPIPKRTTEQIALKDPVPIFVPSSGPKQAPHESPLSPDHHRRDSQSGASPSRRRKSHEYQTRVMKPKYHNEQPTEIHYIPHRYQPTKEAASPVKTNEADVEPESQVSTSIPTNQTTIQLPSTSSQMRDGRTQEFLNESWYQNVYYQNTNDEFSSALESSARQMNMPPNVKNLKSMQQMVTSGPIICDRCRYGPELTVQHSHPCCPAMAQSMAQKGPSYQQGRTTNTTQCDNVCPTRQSFIRTIYNAFKQQLGIPSHTGRPAFDPTVSELYRINISEGSDYQGHPKRVIFDLIDGDMYRPTMTNVGTNTQMGIGHSPLIPQMGIVQPGGNNKLLFNPPPPQQTIYTDQQQSNYNTGAIVINHPQGDQPAKCPSKIAALKQNLRRHQERIDVYYFDHGNASYYRTTDSPGTIYTELIAERTEHNTAQYWAELFGTIHIAFALFTAFFLQLYRFLLQSTVRPLTVGFVQLSSDYMIKPILALLFNAIIQPILIYLYNIATSFRDLCEPIADAFGFFLREIAVPIRAFRFVEVKDGDFIWLYLCPGPVISAQPDIVQNSLMEP